MDVFHCIVARFMMAPRGNIQCLHVSVNVMWVKYNERAQMIVDLCAGCFAALCQITVSVNFMEDAVNTKCNYFYLDD